MYDKRTMMVKEGTVAYGSSLGHYNFFYPDQDKECQFVSDCVVHRNSWMEHNDFVPVKAPKGFVKGDAVEYEDCVVVWVSREDIEKY